MSVSGSAADGGRTAGGGSRAVSGSAAGGGWLRRAWAADGAAGTGFALLVLACVFLAVAGPRADLGLRTSALRQALKVASPQARSVYGTVDATGLDANLGTLPTAASIATTGAQLRSNLEKGHLKLAGGGWDGLASPDFTVTAGLAPAVMATRLPPRLHLVYRDGLSGFGAVTAGRLPAAARAAGSGASFEVALTEAAAARYRLRPGSRIQAGPLTMVVTGVIRPTQAGGAFWTADPELAAPRLAVPPAPPGGELPPPYWSGAVFVGAGEVPVIEQTLDRAETTATWDFPLDIGSLNADGAAALDSALRGALGTSRVVGLGAQPLTLTSGVTQILDVFTAQDASAGTVLRLLAVGLAVIAVVSVLLGGRARERRRRLREALLLARGASRWQVMLGAGHAAAWPALPGAVAGAAVAVAVTPGGATALSWWLAAATLLAALGCGPAVALREYQRSEAARRGTRHRGADRLSGARQGVARRVAAWRRAAAEATLIALAVVGLVLLRAGGGGVFTSLAPALVAAPVAIVVMRGYPLAVTALARLARRRRGVTAFAGLTAAARGTPGALLPGFGLVLAVAVAVFGFLVRDAVDSGVTDASWQQAGADVTVDAQLAYQAPTAATARDVAAVPGVRHTALVSVITAAVNGTTVPIAVLRPAQYAALTAGTPLAPFPAAALSGPGPGGTVPALVTAAGTATLATPSGLAGVDASTPLTVGLERLKIRVRGEVPNLAGLASGAEQTAVFGGGATPGEAGAPQLVVPAWALGAGADASGPPSGPAAALAPPGFLLVTGTGIDTARLLAVIHRDIPGLPPGSVTRRGAVAAALAKAPLARDEFLAVVATTAAAAFLAAIVLVIAIAGAGRERRGVVRRLRLMGASARQGWLTGLGQTLPLVAAAAVGGVACAWILGPLAGPALNLSAFTGSAAAVPVTPRWAPVAAAVAGLIALAVAVLAAATLPRGTSTEENPP